MQAQDLSDYARLLDAAAADPAWFTAAAFEDLGLEWLRSYREFVDLSRGVEWPRWFVGGATNVAWLAIQRWASTDRTAIIWEDDDGSSGQISFAELQGLVIRASNGLRAMGVGPGDVVAIYLPMIPEAVVTLFAAARIGAIAAPAFSGYGAGALAERLRLAGAKVLVTADGFLRRGRPIDTLATASQALAQAPSVRGLVVIERLHGRAPASPVPVTSWTDLVRDASQNGLPEWDSGQPFLLAFTSGSSGRPKGVVHAHSGMPYRVGIELGYNFDLRPGERLCWVTDMGWIMGPISTVGPLTLGAATVLFSGVPDYPDPGRLWDLVDVHQITHLGVSPTAIRLLAGAGTRWVEGHSLTSLRMLGSTGEPWTSAAWRWLHREVGRGFAPIINWSGGTEIGGGILVGSPVVPIPEGRFSGPAPGMSVDVVDDDGEPATATVGELVITKPWPSMTQGFWQEPERYLQTYWSRWPGVWVHGDRAIRYADGTWELPGRSDDVMNVAGKRVGPVEYESVADQVDGVVGAAAVALPDPVKGEVAVVVVVPTSPTRSEAAKQVLSEAVRARIVDVLGKAMAPSAVVVVDALPLTRSGKVHRRAVRSWLLAADPGDLSTLENPEVQEHFAVARQQLQSAG